MNALGKGRNSQLPDRDRLGRSPLGGRARTLAVRHYPGRSFTPARGARLDHPTSLWHNDSMRATEHRMMWWTGLMIVAGFLLLAQAAEAEVRTWTAADGRTVQAELIGFDPVEKMVRLRRADRQEFKFRFSQLIETDQKFVLDRYRVLSDGFPQRIDDLVRKRLGEQLNSQPYFTTLQTMVDRPAESDAEFVSRMHVEIIGREPSAEELAKFSQNTASDKRRALIDALLVSEDFVKHFTNNFLAELLQVDGARPAKVPYAECEGKEDDGKKRFRESRAGRRAIPQPAQYREWIEQQVRTDLPWDELVRELLTASGRFTENPATGYLIANSGEPYLNVNPASVMTALSGIEITCAQCHDHPHEEIYQMDYFKLAAFFGGLAVDFSKNAATATGYDYELSDHPKLGLRLPPDYAYDDGDAGDQVSPSAYFGGVPKIEDPTEKRQAFAVWLTEPQNPRFTLNIANRLWAYVFGHAPIQPIDNLPGHLAEGSYDMALMNFLRDMMQTEEFHLREFLRALYHTETFSGIPPKDGKEN